MAKQSALCHADKNNVGIKQIFITHHANIGKLFQCCLNNKYSTTDVVFLSLS